MVYSNAIDAGQRILAIDENEVYIVGQSITSDDKATSKTFDFLARKESNGVVRGFSFAGENTKYTRL